MGVCAGLAGSFEALRSALNATPELELSTPEFAETWGSLVGYESLQEDNTIDLDLGLAYDFSNFENNPDDKGALESGLQALLQQTHGAYSVTVLDMWRNPYLVNETTTLSVSICFGDEGKLPMGTQALHRPGGSGQSACLL